MRHVERGVVTGWRRGGLEGKVVAKVIEGGEVIRDEGWIGRNGSGGGEVLSTNDTKGTKRGDPRNVRMERCAGQGEGGGEEGGPVEERGVLILRKLS